MRQKSATLLGQSAELVKQSRSAIDVQRIEALMEEAKEAAEGAKRHVESATGGTGVAVGLENSPYKATPRTAEGVSFRPAVYTDAEVEAIPERERANCFFCSRPVRLSDLTPMIFAAEGKRRRVLACVDDVKTVREGAAPAVRTVEEEGHNVPWFRSQSYNPQRDYRQPLLGRNPQEGLL